MRDVPWDQRLARMLVRPLARTRVSPNHLTTVGLITGLAAAGLYAWGDKGAADWAAVLFVLASFMDHADGELARLSGKTSQFGYYYDQACGAITYTALFAGIGLGLRDSALGWWALPLGVVDGIAVSLIFTLRFEIERRRGWKRLGQPGFAGFEVEDIMYLVGPVTWLGWLLPFLVVASVGAPAFALWTLWQMRKGVAPEGEAGGL
ncbi:MAG: CDP-alcohol phosphatidyltransferase family protein [Alphaproteobacteria bacterium]